MNRPAAPWLTWTTLFGFLFVGGVNPSAARSTEIPLNGHVFVLPEGFTIELVAGPPLVDRPITASFDDAGRLYVADSSGSNEKPDKQLVERTHRIVRLEDSDGDGQFDKQTVFADRMMFPEGTMWLAGSVYVAAPPSIWKLTDTDGDGVADERVEWFQGKTLTGCANDLHGPYAGPDGWIYWCKGAFAEQTYERPGKSPFVTKAAHIFRCRPDGSGIEPVMTGGMDNPVDVVFTPGGERIFTTTFFQHPSGGRRDGLIHAIYGGVYGKVHDPIEHHPRTGDILPPLTHMGAAAPCGLERYRSSAFGDDYRDNLFACQFNMHKVSRHVLTPRGATFDSRDEDFVVSKNFDFHPTDVLEDADGSLIVVDTGGWYKLCCPTSQLSKPDILGAVYRVRRTGAPRVNDPRGRRIDWNSLDDAELAALLADDRFAVCDQATHRLALRGSATIAAVRSVLRSASAAARRNALWTLTRINDAAARQAVREALSDRDESVRQVALHSISLWRDRDAQPKLISLLESGSPHNRRAAAEALGRIGDQEAADALLTASGHLGPAEKRGAEKSGSAAAEPAKALERDRFLEHSLTFALIEIGDPAVVGAGIAFAQNGWTQRAALIAADQMEGGQLRPELVSQLLSAENLVVKDAAAWIVSRHPEWGSALAGYLKDRVDSHDLTDADRNELERQLAQFARAPEVQALLGDALSNGDRKPAERRMLLRAMRSAGVGQVPAAWIGPLSHALAVDDADLLHEAVATTRALGVPKEGVPEWKAALLDVARDRNHPDALRLEALAAVPGGLDAVDAETFDFLRAGLNVDNPVLMRSAAADVLAGAKLSSEQLLELTKIFASAGPLEADKLLGAFEQSSDEAVGTALVAALKSSPALAALRVDSIRLRLAKQSASVQALAEELYALINIDIAQQRQKLEEMLPLMKTGDVRRGQEVFRREKSACITCHGFGYAGGNVGPDLTRIGGIRTERDLLESILFPSASFVRSFEPVSVVTVAGKSYNGLVRKDAPDELILQTSATETVRIPRDDVEEMRPSSVSVMPAGLDKQLTPQELADLVAFLKNAK